MNKWLPLFPLKIVVFPGEKLNLHIFEPRYKQLIEECERDKTPFGIPTFFENKDLSFGTEIKLDEIVHRYPDDKLDIKVRGLRVFKIIKLNKRLADKLYPAGEVEYIEQDNTKDVVISHLILEKLKELFLIMKITKEIPELDQNFDSFKIAHLVGLSLEQEYQILSLPTEIKRLNFIHSHLVSLIPVVIEMENLRMKAEMNGHFKNLIPPDF